MSIDSAWVSFRRFAHHAEDGQAVGALFVVEVDHAVDAGRIDRAVCREKACRR
jgi:hypothetical protein